MQLSPSLPFSEHALANISRLTAEIKNRWRWLFTMRLAREKNDSVPDSFNTMLTLDALRRDWRIKRKLHNYIEEPSKWQGYNIYMATLTLSVDFEVSGRERILHLCSSTKQKKPLPPRLAHITLLSPAQCMSKQDRQKAQCWSLYRREYIQLPASCPVSCKSYLQGRREGVTLEHLSLSTAGHSRGLQVAQQTQRAATTTG